MHYVFLLQSVADEQQKYVGFANDLKATCQTPQRSSVTSHCQAYAVEVVTHFAFENERRARELEYYLKTGSGSAFANNRLW
jgi:hypothetical protein